MDQFSLVGILGEDNAAGCFVHDVCEVADYLEAELSDTITGVDRGKQFQLFSEHEGRVSVWEKDSA